MSRPLSPEESALWSRVTATIRPLSRETQDIQSAAAIEPLPPKPAQTRKLVPTRKPAVPAPKPLRPGTTLDGTWDRTLRSGSVQPDRIVDLHGMDLDRAWNAIDFALERASDAGETGEVDGSAR